MKKAQNTIFGLNLHIPPLCSVGAEPIGREKHLYRQIAWLFPLIKYIFSSN